MPTSNTRKFMKKKKGKKRRRMCLKHSGTRSEKMRGGEGDWLAYKERCSKETYSS